MRIESKDLPKTTSKLSRRAVFLDRDGVLNVDQGYVHKVEDLELITGVGRSLAELKRRGFLLVVVSNQSGVGRGYFTAAAVDAFHAAMQTQLRSKFGVSIDAFYVCYDPPQTPSTHRKPAPGMVLDAARDLGIELASSWLVGDRDTDIECGRAAGVRAIHITSGTAHPAAFAHAVDLADALVHLV